uniref:U10-Eretoxin-Ek1p_1 n=1 Tax=Eresus cinnaberinus TaxID=175337 RepID=A0A2D0PBR3_ERECI
MAARVIAIISAIVLAFGFIECGRCPYEKFTPNHSFCKPPNPSCNNPTAKVVGAGDRMKILKTSLTITEPKLQLVKKLKLEDFHQQQIC